MKMLYQTMTKTYPYNGTVQAVQSAIPHIYRGMHLHCTDASKCRISANCAQKHNYTHVYCRF